MVFAAIYSNASLNAILTVNAANASTTAVTSPMEVARAHHTATFLNNGTVLMAGGAGGNAQLESFDPSSATFQPVSSLTVARSNHTATLLFNGQVLITGGTDGNGVTLASAELYDPVAGVSTATGSLLSPRSNHRATLLNDGRVLITGGLDASGNSLASAEIYDPSTGGFTLTGTMELGRSQHTATLLNDGRVLVAGAADYSTHTIGSTWGGCCWNVVWTDGEPSAELYDPATGVFTATGSMQVGRWDHTATLLNNGQVLILGGGQASEAHTEAGDGIVYGTWVVTADAELYDPSSGIFVSVAGLNAARAGHTATLLPNGQVLVAGGESYNYYGPTPNNSTELYDPSAGLATAGPTLAVPRSHHSATRLINGSVLLAGGGDNTAEIVAPGTDDLPGLTAIDVNPVPAYGSVPVTLSQRYVAIGSLTGGMPQILKAVAWSSSNPTTATISNDHTNSGIASALAVGSTNVQACVGTVCGSTGLTLTPPSALLLSVAVHPGGVFLAIGQKQIFTASSLQSDGTTQDVSSSVVWSSSNPSVAVVDASGVATAIAPGVAAVTATLGVVTGSATIQVPTGLTWDPANWGGLMQAARVGHTANLLADGQVLVAGGTTASFAEMFTPSSGPTYGQFSTAATMTVPRSFHTATSLQDGRVLIVGGVDATGAPTAVAEIYDPLLATFAVTGSLVTPRSKHRATLLNDGRVLITGGLDASGTPLATTEIFDPSSGAFTLSGSMELGRSQHTATLLGDGRVLVAGGADYSTHQIGVNEIGGGCCWTVVWTDGEPSAELYDPAFGVFTPTGSMQVGRWDHTATLLNSGQVLILGGGQASEEHAIGGYGTEEGVWNVTADAEVYDPPSGAFISVSALNTARAGHTAALLPNGQVLVAGGEYYNQWYGPVSINSTEVYDPSIPLATVGPTLGVARSHHTATTLVNGSVLLAGGGDNTSELYWPGASASAVAPIQVSPPSWNFGNQPIGMSSGATRFIVSNTGTATLSLNSIALTAGQVFSISSNTCGATIQAKSACTVSVQFTPTASGPASDSLQISSGSPAIIQTVSLRGTGALTSVTLSPASVNFGSQTLSSTSLGTVSVTNTGSASLTGAIAASITGPNGSDFSVSTNGCSGLTSLPPGSSCLIMVAFTPSGAGSRNGVLSLTDNASGSPQTVSLTGTGPAPSVSLSTTALSFGNQPVGIPAQSETVTLQNSGTASLSITSIALSGPNEGDFSDNISCGTSLGVGASCTIGVTFTPSFVGPESAALVITDDAASSPQAVSLTGAGAQAATTTSISAPAISYGTAANVTVTVTSGQGTVTGNVSLIVDNALPLTQPLSGGSTVFSVSGLGGGSHSLTANYGAQGSFASSLATGTLQVSQVQPTVTFTGAPASAPYHSTFTVTATTNASSAVAITATGACSIAGNTVTMTSATGTCSLMANWPSDNNYLATSATQSTTATKATPTVTFTGAPATAAYKAAFTVTATTNASTTASITATGVCTISGSTVTMTSGTGTCSLTATWASDNNYLAASASQLTTAMKANSTTAITTHTPSTSVVGQAITVKFKVSPVSPATTTPTGSVTASDSTGDMCTATVATGSCSLSATTAGKATLTANYSGDTNFNSSTSPGVAQTVNKASTKTTITSQSPNPSVAGQAVTVTFTVVPVSPGSGTPTGSVTVSDPAGDSCTATVATRSCAITISASGSKTLKASYGGDTNFNSGTSVGVTQAVTDFSISAPASKTVKAGQQTTLNVTMTSKNSFTGTVALSCTGAPAGSTCSLSPASVVFVSGSTKTTSTATIQAGARTAKGTYTLTFTGVYGSGAPASGGLTHSANVSLTVD